MAVTAIFNQLLQKPKEDPIELDQIHRKSGLRNPDPSFVHDILCRAHFYMVKESIMHVTSTQDTILFNDTSVMLLPDLSRQTLAIQKALKLLMQLEQERSGIFPSMSGFTMRAKQHYSAP